MTKKLKSCPFCGGEVIPPDEDDLVYFVNHNEGCFLKHFKTFTDYTIEAWNRREPIDKIVEQLEEYKNLECDDIDDDIDEDVEDAEELYDIGRSQGKLEAYLNAIEIVKGGNT